MSKIQAFAVTIRPKGGLTDEALALCIETLKKKSKMLYAITEMQDTARHLHAAAIWKEPSTVSHVNEYLRRKLQPLVEATESIAKIMIKTKTWYARNEDENIIGDWSGWEDYLLKEADEPEFDDMDWAGAKEYLVPNKPIEERQANKNCWPEMSHLMTLLEKHEPEFYENAPWVCTAPRLHDDYAETNIPWDPCACVECVYEPWMTKLNNLAYYHKCWKPPKDVRTMKTLCMHAVRYRKGSRNVFNDSGERHMTLGKRKFDTRESWLGKW